MTMAQFPDLPILVGITGHRDIHPAAAAGVRQATRDALAELAKTFPAQLLVVTALAEGADQLAAEVAEELGIGLVAVSPMPLGRYRTTIEDPAAALALDRLWHSPAVVQRIELPMLDLPEPSDAAQYEQLGLLLSRRSHILLALWNGDDPERQGQPHHTPRQTRGGTPHVVAIRQSGERDEAASDVIGRGVLFEQVSSRLNRSLDGPILQVVTPRRKDDGRASLGGGRMVHPAGTLLWWWDIPAAPAPDGLLQRIRYAFKPAEHGHAPGRADWTTVSAAELDGLIPADLRRIRMAGLSLAQEAAQRAKSAAAGSSYLCTDDQLSGRRDTAGLRRLRDLFDAVDADASATQRKLFGAWLPGLPWPKSFARWFRGTPLGALLLFAAAVPTATLCFEIFTELGHNPWWLAGYFVSLLVPLLFYASVVRPGRWQERYQDHRALAEGLRVQFFWAASGLRTAVADSYLRHQRGALGWIRLALQGPALLALVAADGGTPDLVFLRARWISDQAKYFGREASAQSVAAGRMQLGARLSIGTLFVGAAILLCVVAGHGWHYPHSHPEYLAELPLVALGTLPAAVAFFLIIAESRAYEEHAHAYDLARDVFTEADRQAGLLPQHDVQALYGLLLALGHEALTENAIWIATHRTRPVASRIG